MALTSGKINLNDENISVLKKGGNLEIVEVDADLLGRAVNSCSNILLKDPYGDPGLLNELCVGLGFKESVQSDLKDVTGEFCPFYCR